MTHVEEVCPRCGETHSDQQGCPPPGGRTATRLPAPAVKVPGFEVLGPLGEGAMGTVYLAEDSTLRRRVAIKLISAKLSSDEDALRRFLREARAMAIVEHPHVVRIYGFGEDREAPYIVMELVEGESLRDRIARQGKLSLDEALAITRQIALGLEAAAARGIVHRDVKPSNVLLDRAGQVRVADFGLSRPVVAEDSSLTGSGSFVGTPHYVSPEQARGEAVDFRSDMCSLGIVLYEMLTGDKPFKGSTPVLIVSQHLHESLPSLRKLHPELPQGVVELVERMTSKDPGARPASYAALRESLDVLTVEQGRAVARPKRWSRAARLGVAAGAVVGLALVAVLVARRIPRAGKPPTPIQIEKLTNRGTVWQAALSRDGRYLAYLSDGLWVKDLREKTETRLTLPIEARAAGLEAISPDGSYVYYSVLPPGAFELRLFRVPLIGGAPQLVIQGGTMVLSPDHTRVIATTRRGVLVSNGDGTSQSTISPGDAWGAAVAWAPDGKRVLLLKSGSLYEVDPAGGGERNRGDLSGFSTDNATMSLRPSGEILALGMRKPEEPGAFLYALDLRSGTKRPLGEDAWRSIDRLEWLPDGSALVVSGSVPGQVWLVSFPDGARRAIPGDYNLIGITADGEGIVANQAIERSELLVSDPDEPSGFKRLVVGTAPFSLCWTPGGEIVYSSLEAGNGTFDLYVLQPESQARRQLTFARSGGAVDPAASPDGRYVVFGGKGGLWRVSMDGTDLVKLVTTTEQQRPWMRPQVSPDSQWVLYFEDNGANGGPTLRRVPIDGGTPLTIKGSGEGDPRPWEAAVSGGWSRRGQEVAFLYFTVPEAGQTPVEVAISSLEGVVRRRFPYTPHTRSWAWDHQRIQWSAEGPDRYLYFQRDGQLWKQPVAGGPALQVTHFDEGIFDFDWSLDGKRLACSRSMGLSDIVLITGFR